MSRKQYARRVMELKRKIAKSGNSKHLNKLTDKFIRPQFGTIIKAGVHKGEILISYKQCWENLYSLLGDIY